MSYIPPGFWPRLTTRLIMFSLSILSKVGFAMTKVCDHAEPLHAFCSRLSPSTFGTVGCMPSGPMMPFV